MHLVFPIEFLVHGTPVSLQAKRASSRQRWKEQVREAARAVLPEDYFAFEGPLAVTLYYFPDGIVRGDIDNIVKLTLDALVGTAYLNDRQVDRLVVQKFERPLAAPFSNPSPILHAALAGPRPVLYLRLSDDPFEDLT